MARPGELVLERFCRQARQRAWARILMPGGATGNRRQRSESGQEADDRPLLWTIQWTARQDVGQQSLAVIPITQPGALRHHHDTISGVLAASAPHR